MHSGLQEGCHNSQNLIQEGREGEEGGGEGEEGGGEGEEGGEERGGEGEEGGGEEQMERGVEMNNNWEVYSLLTVCH